MGIIDGSSKDYQNDYFRGLKNLVKSTASVLQKGQDTSLLMVLEARRLILHYKAFLLWKVG